MISTSLVIEVALTVAGFELAFWPLWGFFGTSTVVAYAAHAAVLTWFAFRARPTRSWVRMLRRLSWPIVAAIHLALAIEAIVLADILAWAVPRSMKLLVGLTVGAWAYSMLRPTRGIRVPAVLPMGMWIFLCMMGWADGRGRLSCEERQRALSSPGAILVAASVDHCEGTAVTVGRFPKKVLDAADGARVFFTSDAPPDSAPVFLEGSICEAGGTEPVTCVGTGNGNGFIVAGADRLFAPVFGDFGNRRGIVYDLSTTPLRIERFFDTTVPTAHGYYDPVSDELGVFSNAAEAEPAFVVRVKADDWRPLAPGYLLSIPNDVRYDADRREGLVCPATASFDAPFPLSLASTFSVDPFEPQSVGRSALALFSWGGGCDWDASHRRIYATIPALGLLAEIVRDTGQVVGIRYVGIGVRAVAIDDGRHRLHLGNYFSGEVSTYDLDSGAELGRRFAGRYLADLRITNDRRGLLSASIAGVFRLPLE